MLNTIGISNLKVEKTGVTTNVPKNDLAKLMYYLSCVFIVINYEHNNKLSDYKNFSNLNEQEKKLVYTLSILFEPKIFISAGIFIVKPELLPPSRANDFFKITDERIGVHVSNEIIIGGRTVKVLNIMVCKTPWLDRNYYSPLKNIIPKQENNEVIINQNISGNTSSRNNLPTDSNKIIANENEKKKQAFPSSDILSDYGSFKRNASHKKKSWNCCCICGCFCLWITVFFIILFIIVAIPIFGH